MRRVVGHRGGGTVQHSYVCPFSIVTTHVGFQLHDSHVRNGTCGMADNIFWRLYMIALCRPFFGFLQHTRGCRGSSAKETPPSLLRQSHLAGGVDVMGGIPKEILIDTDYESNTTERWIFDVNQKK